MKVKSIRSNENSTSLYENLVDKSFGNAKLKLSSDGRFVGGNKSSKQSKNESCSNDLFLELPELVRLEIAASILGISIKTIYDWRYRSKQRKIPHGLFVKINRSLMIRTSVLREWIASQNPALKGGQYVR